jgi:hypothetical protein
MGREPVMFDPDAHMPRINRGMVYLGACLIRSSSSMSALLILC